MCASYERHIVGKPYILDVLENKHKLLKTKSAGWLCSAFSTKFISFLFHFQAHQVHMVFLRCICHLLLHLIGTNESGRCAVCVYALVLPFYLYECHLS